MIMLAREKKLAWEIPWTEEPGWGSMGLQESDITQQPNNNTLINIYKVMMIMLAKKI